MERLQKVMAEAGVASRRASEKLIASGHVQVNGQTVRTLGTRWKSMGSPSTVKNTFTSC